MKKVVLALVVTIGSLSTVCAQKEVKYSKLYYKNSTTETNEVTITVDNAVSTDGETKFKLKITNKTADYIMFKPEECKFVIGGKELKPSEKAKIIKPNDSDFLIVNLKGAGYNSVKSYTFEIGGLYKLSTSGKVVPAEDFKLPAAKNDFKAGSYNCSLSSLTKESDKTDAKFTCSYTGDKIGIVFPAKISVKMPDGNEYAAVKPTGLLAKPGPFILNKGESVDFSAHWDRMQGGKAMDMQKVEMMVKFNDTFTEATPEKLKNETLTMEFDQATSDAKGK